MFTCLSLTFVFVKQQQYHFVWILNILDVLYPNFSSVQASFKFNITIAIATMKPRDNQCHHPVRFWWNPCWVPGSLHLAALWPCQVKDPLDARASCPASFLISVLIFCKSHKPFNGCDFHLTSFHFTDLHYHLIQLFYLSVSPFLSFIIQKVSMGH